MMGRSEARDFWNSSTVAGATILDTIQRHTNYRAVHRTFGGLFVSSFAMRFTWHKCDNADMDRIAYQVEIDQRLLAIAAGVKVVSLLVLVVLLLWR